MARIARKSRSKVLTRLWATLGFIPALLGLTLQWRKRDTISFLYDT